MNRGFRSEAVGGGTEVFAAEDQPYVLTLPVVVLTMRDRYPFDADDAHLAVQGESRATAVRVLGKNEEGGVAAVVGAAAE